MHCPRCGTVAPANQQFCRSCGLHLEQVAAVLEPLSSNSEITAGEIERLKELQRKHESWGGIAGLIAVGLALLLFIVLVFSQMILRGGGLSLLGLILILVAAAAGVMGYFQLSAKSLKQKLGEPQLPPAREPQIDSPTFSPAASVTENTTKLLIEPDDRSTHEIAN